MRGFPAACAAVAAALATAGGAWAGGPARYDDPTGDASAGPDIASVSVANEIDGPVVMSIALAAPPAAEDDSTYVILFDADRNARTGNGGGFEYAFVDAPDGWDFMRWDGSAFASAGEHVFMLPSSDAATPFVLSLAQSDLGSPAAFDFAVVTLQGEELTAIDAGPDGGVWTYTMTKRPTIASVAVTLSGAARAGKAFGAKGATVRLGDGRTVKAEYVTCKITVGARHVPGTACWVNLRKTDRGKTVVVRVTATYEQATAAKTVRTKVR